MAPMRISGSYPIPLINSQQSVDTKQMPVVLIDLFDSPGAGTYSLAGTSPA